MAANPNLGDNIWCEVVNQLTKLKYYHFSISIKLKSHGIFCWFLNLFTSVEQELISPFYLFIYINFPLHSICDNFCCPFGTHLVVIESKHKTNCNMLFLVQIVNKQVVTNNYHSLLSVWLCIIWSTTTWYNLILLLLLFGYKSRLVVFCWLNVNLEK